MNSNLKCTKTKDPPLLEIKDMRIIHRVGVPGPFHAGLWSSQSVLALMAHPQHAGTRHPCFASQNAMWRGRVPLSPRCESTNSISIPAKIGVSILIFWGKKTKKKRIHKFIKIYLAFNHESGQCFLGEIRHCGEDMLGPSAILTAQIDKCRMSK